LKSTVTKRQWCPFRPSAADLERLLANNADLKFLDRVAHQYQIAGSRAAFQIANDLLEPLCGVGLFQPSAHYRGVWRISAGLGRAYLETLESGVQQNDSGYE